MKIEILEKKANEKTITSKDGKQYQFTEQEAYYHDGQKYPKKFKISIQSGSQPYDPGLYTISAESVYVDRYGNINFARNLKLNKS